MHLVPPIDIVNFVQQDSSHLVVVREGIVLRQPLGNFSLNVSYNDVVFPEGFGNSRLLLIGPRAEFTFNRSLFWTTFLQYNTQSENFNVNSRLQWRFAPMSDVFLVFTDNMTTTDFSQKNWGIVLKMNYWLAL